MIEDDEHGEHTAESTRIWHFLTPNVRQRPALEGPLRPISAPWTAWRGFGWGKQPLRCAGGLLAFRNWNLGSKNHATDGCLTRDSHGRSVARLSLLCRRPSWAAGSKRCDTGLPKKVTFIRFLRTVTCHTGTDRPDEPKMGAQKPHSCSTGEQNRSSPQKIQ